MKNTLIFISIFLFCCCNNFPVLAQTGWTWGISSSSNGMYDEYQTVIDRAGNVYVSGIFEGDSIIFGPSTIHNSGFSSLYQQLVIAKVNASGGYQWAVGTSGPAHTSVNTVAMATDYNGDLYFLGNYDGSSCTIGGINLTNPSLYSMGLLIKISSTGTVLWAKNIGAVRGSGGIGVDDAGNIYISESFTEPTISFGATTLTNADPSGGLGGTGDVFIAKFTPSGSPVWARGFGSIGDDVSKVMAVSGLGNIYLFGENYVGNTFTIAGTVTVDSTSYLAKFDSSGAALWAKNYSYFAHTQPKGMALDVLDNIYITGGTQSGEFSLAKYNASGDIAWEKITGSADGAGKFGYSIALDLCGHLWTCGTMAAYYGHSGYTIDFPGYTLACPSGSYDPMFIAEYDTAGNYLSSIALPSGGEDENSISVDNSGNFIVAGDYYMTTKMVFGNDSFYTPAIQESIFLAKYKYDVTLCPQEIELSVKPEAISLSDAISIYPNPAIFECTIQYAVSFLPGSKAELYDLTGRLINTYPLSGSGPVISLSRIVPGMYQCRLTTSDGNVVVKKLVVMK